MENRPMLPDPKLPPPESEPMHRTRLRKQLEETHPIAMLMEDVQVNRIRARVTHLQPELGVQIVNGEGDNLRQISYKTPEPIPRADPEGRGRTIGQRVDEMIAEAESRAARDYQRATEEAA